jgi:hypothetical protein
VRYSLFIIWIQSETQPNRSVVRVLRSTCRGFSFVVVDERKRSLTQQELKAKRCFYSIGYPLSAREKYRLPNAIFSLDIARVGEQLLSSSGPIWKIMRSQSPCSYTRTPKKCHKQNSPPVRDPRAGLTKSFRQKLIS